LIFYTAYVLDKHIGMTNVTFDPVNIHATYYQQLQYKGVNSQTTAVKVHKSTVHLI